MKRTISIFLVLFVITTFTLSVFATSTTEKNIKNEISELKGQEKISTIKEKLVDKNIDKIKDLKELIAKIKENRKEILELKKAIREEYKNKKAKIKEMRANKKQIKKEQIDKISVSTKKLSVCKIELTKTFGQVNSFANRIKKDKNNSLNRIEMLNNIISVQNKRIEYLKEVLELIKAL